jgi:tRNA threonylcarbamoyladenosine biosynthesis protein TsaB
LPTILSIETATLVCSVALSRNGQLLTVKETSVKNAHSSVLTFFIEEVCRMSGIAFPEIDAVAVSEGPGSYTGLRIGVAAAKGLCYAIEKPLIAIPTLQALASGMKKSISLTGNNQSDQLFCPMIDARRMEVFLAVYNNELEEVVDLRAEIIDGNSFADLLKDHTFYFAGDGAAKCKSLFEGKQNVQFLDDFHVSAKYIFPLAEAKFRSAGFENLAYFEPRYLKEFVAGKPKVKGLEQ